MLTSAKNTLKLSPDLLLPYFFGDSSPRSPMATKSHESPPILHGATLLTLPSFTSHASATSSETNSKPSTPRIEEWFSLEGYLYMKTLGPLNFLQSKKKFYFGLDELENRLVYYKDEIDFYKKLNRIGIISLVDSACTTIDSNPKGFVVHSQSKRYELEGENEQCAHCWLFALQRRKDAAAANNNNNNNGGSTAGDTSSHAKDISLPSTVWHNLRRHQSRSSLGSDDDMPYQSYQPQKRYPRKINRRVKSFKIPRVHRSSITSDVDQNMNNTAANHDDALCNGHGLKPASKAIDTNSEHSTISENLPKFSESPKMKAKTFIATPEKPARKVSAPLWLNDWIHTWLRDQSTTPTSDPISEGNQSHYDACTSEEVPIHPSVTSTTTSTYDSDDAESVISDFDDNISNMTEVEMLRAISNRQKQYIEKLKAHQEKMQSEMEKLQKFKELIEKENTDEAIAAQNRFLNSEILRLNDRQQVAYRKTEDIRKQVIQLETEMENFKKEYVFLLQSCVRIPLYDHGNFDIIQVKLFGGDVHEKRVKKLLEAARINDPTLPTFESVLTTTSYHVDEYGFRHCFKEAPLALHYICTQLHQHYQSQSEAYVQRKKQWQFIINNEHSLSENNSLIRQLCRAGIPRSMRSSIWRILIHQKVHDIKQKYGNYYYRNLCQSHGSSAEKHYINVHQKQINLDLLRTMPNNIHFMSATCKGVTQLQSILRAFCLHNPTIGYCQGMNFVTATILLFVSPEDAFWFLVAITECYFDKSYYDQSLTGAQADQEVLKDIVELKYPQLAKHLEKYEIDLTTITLNWFLALFFDAVPFQTMLRIWDCFLLEGSKALFRISISMLGLFEEEILNRSDTISVIKVLKAATRLTFDADGLIYNAFEELKPFPSKTQLAAKQKMYLAILHDRLLTRKKIRELLRDETVASKSLSRKLHDLPVQFMNFPVEKASNHTVGYIGIGNQIRGKLAIITFDDSTHTHLQLVDIEFDCRPISMVLGNDDIAFVSLLSGYVVALHLNGIQSQVLWELKLSDIALKLVHHENKLYCALANGTLTVFENAFNKAPTALDFIHIPVSAAPISDAVIIDDCLYLAVACKLVMLHKSTLSPVDNVYVAASTTGCAVPMFEKVRSLTPSQYGIWVITVHSSLVQLWKENECQLLFDITYDHSHRKPSFDESDEFDNVEINAIQFFDDELWIGTVDGYLMIYDVQENTAPSKPMKLRHATSDSDLQPVKRRPKPSISSEVAFSLHKYPRGKRLIPDNNSTQQPGARQQTYYIPTQKETQVEELTSEKERSPNDLATRKVSVVIDQCTKQYKVSVMQMRSVSIDSANGTMKTNSTSIDGGSTTNTAKPSLEHCDNKHFLQTKRRLLQGTSLDSAVSVFSDEHHPVDLQVTHPEVFARSSRESMSSTQHAEDDYNMDSVSRPPSPLFGLEGSMEYDDLFEMYPESDIGLVEDALHDLSPPPAVKLVQIPIRNHGKSLTGLDSIDSSFLTSQGSVQSDAPTLIPPNREVESTSPPLSPTLSDVPKLRRKDLDFDDTVMVAVKENVGQLRSNKRRSLIDFNYEMPELIQTEIKSTLIMNLQMKLKISDKPVKCIEITRTAEEVVIVTGAGNYGDEEAILRWRKEKNTGLWINDPLVDNAVHGRRRTVISKKSA